MVTVATLLRPGGAKAVVAKNQLLKQQLLPEGGPNNGLQILGAAIKSRQIIKKVHAVRGPETKWETQIQPNQPTTKSMKTAYLPGLTAQFFLAILTGCATLLQDWSPGRRVMMNSTVGLGPPGLANSLGHELLCITPA